MAGKRARAGICGRCRDCAPVLAPVLAPLQVTWWDSADTASTPATGSFSTALLAGIADGQGAAWIAPAPGANTLRAEFTLSAAPLRARLFVSGLGYYRSWLNGRLTDDHVLGPFLEFSQRVVYNVWDVTDLLKPGCNALAVALGTVRGGAA